MIHLNLLPPERLRTLAADAQIGRWRSAAWLGAAASVLVLGIFFALAAWLNNRQQTLAADITTLNQEFDNSDTGAVRRQIQSLNQATDIFSQALATDRSWAASAAAVLNSLPTKTQLTKLSISASGDVTLAGISKVRADFLAFDEAMKKNTILTEVSTDSTANRRENLPYEYTAKLAPAKP